jgi:hypothetical protein
VVFLLRHPKIILKGKEAFIRGAVCRLELK